MVKINQRIERTNLVCDTIKKAFGEGRNINKEKLISVLMLKLFCSRRIALEYIMACLSEYEIKEEKVDEEIFIINLEGMKNE